jgi:hypothetical protein
MRVAEGGWRWVFGCFFADAINKARIAERVELLRRFHMAPAWAVRRPSRLPRFLALLLATSLDYLPANITCNIITVTCRLHTGRINSSQACASSYLLYNIHSGAVLISRQHVRSASCE